MSIGISQRLRYAILLKQARDGVSLEDKEVAKAVWALAGLRAPTPTTISRYLNGGRAVPCEMIPYFADFLDCELRWLILGDGAPPTLTPAESDAAYRPRAPVGAQRHRPHPQKAPRKK